MKHILLLSLGLISSTLFCHGQSRHGNSRFTIGLAVSPGYSYRTLQPIQYEAGYYQSKNELYRSLVDSLNTVESGRLAWTFGLTLRYQISQRFALKSGFY